MWYLEREISGRGSIQYVLVIEDDERMVPSQIREICSHLSIPPDAFGLVLG